MPEKSSGDLNFHRASSREKNYDKGNGEGAMGNASGTVEKAYSELPLSHAVYPPMGSSIEMVLNESINVRTNKPFYRLFAPTPAVHNSGLFIR